MIAFDEIAGRMPFTVARFGLRQPDKVCHNCGATGTVLGTVLCEEHYVEVFTAAPRRRQRSSTAQDAARLARAVAIQGSVSAAQVESDHGVTHAGLMIVGAVGKGWVTEDDDDYLRPTGKLPPGQASKAARRALKDRPEVPAIPKSIEDRTKLLVVFLGTQSRVVTRLEAAEGMGLGPSAFDAVAKRARERGLVTSTRGPGGGYSLPKTSVPVPA